MEEKREEERRRGVENKNREEKRKSAAGCQREVRSSFPSESVAAFTVSGCELSLIGGAGTKVCNDSTVKGHLKVYWPLLHRAARAELSVPQREHLNVV